MNSLSFKYAQRNVLYDFQMTESSCYLNFVYLHNSLIRDSLDGIELRTEAFCQAKT